MEPRFTSPNELKVQLGRRATFTWLVGGGFLFLMDGGPEALVSLNALAFLGIGMFAAAVIVGNLSYFLLVRFGDRYFMRHQYTLKRPWLLGDALAVVFLLWCYASFFWL